MECVALLSFYTVVRTAMSVEGVADVKGVAEIQREIHRVADMTMSLFQKEASGYGILSTMRTFFTQAFTASGKSVFKYDAQFVVAKNQSPGVNPCSDVSVCISQVPSDSSHSDSSVRIRGKFKPWILYKYKPTVVVNLEKVQDEPLIELLLQSYYAMKYHEVQKLVACLTDLSSWHYFVCLKDGGPLQIERYSYVSNETKITEDELHLHAKLLIKLTV